MRQRAMAPTRRRGVILLVVLCLLTLFSVLGLAFVLYAQAQARASRLFRDASNLDRPDVDCEVLLAYFLGQLVYDANDTTDAFSALRGHGLARNLYGWNRDDPGGNQVPWGGTGRLHTDAQTSLNPWKLDDFYLINYTVHPADNFRRDPERWRDLHTGGANPPYTYPDLNHLFLSAVRADGTVLLPSFHRPWTDRAHPDRYFGSLDPANLNWHDQSRPWLKYLVLRPRPADHPAPAGRPGFPAPEDAGGDVKNLVGAPGGNDSIWIDLDFPVMEAPDGRKFKPLFAPLIVDLDGRVNLNVHGNVRGRDGNGRPVHVSNQGWGPWEVNLGHVLSLRRFRAEPDEWTNLCLGGAAAGAPGRYGPDGRPGRAGSQVPLGPLFHFYDQGDFDACQVQGGVLVPTSGPFQLPG